ncbi:hypothetical protein TNCV_3022651 [Trichonephila clavipes]|nr:hypothetical protein TNCV_3022651 [Trichonephila clavipes]
MVLSWISDIVSLPSQKPLHQLFEPSSVRHRLPQFVDRCPHPDRLSQSKTIQPRIVPIPNERPQSDYLSQKSVPILPRSLYKPLFSHDHPPPIPFDLLSIGRLHRESVWAHSPSSIFSDVLSPQICALCLDNSLGQAVLDCGPRTTEGQQCLFKGARVNEFQVTSRYKNTRAIEDGPRSFELRSKDEDDTRAGLSPPYRANERT